MTGSQRYVITGASAIGSLGTTREAVLDALRTEKDGHSRRPAPAWTQCAQMTAAWAVDFKPSPLIPPMKARRMERSSQMAIVAAAGALRQAAWDVPREGSDALGVFVGSGFCGTHSSLSILQTLYSQGAEEVSAAAFPNTVPNAPAGQLAIHFGLEGPSATLLQTGTTADSALLCALGQLDTEQCRAALWGCADELSEYLWFGWKQMGLTGCSRQREEADIECSRRRKEAENSVGLLTSAATAFGLPQHPRSRGFMAGESAAMTLIEPAESARSRNRRPLARIEYAATGAVEAQPWAYPKLEKAGEIVSFFRAAVNGGRSPDLVIGCSNGHPNLDRLERAVLAPLLGDRVPVWFAKGQVGETMGSAALRATLAIWLMEEGFVPGNFWLRDCEPPAGLDVPLESVARPIHRVLIPTISAGGTLGAIVVCRAG